MTVKLYKVIDNSGTKYLPNPLEMGQIVEFVEEVDEKSIKVKHSGATSIFYRSRFKRFIEKPQR